MSAAVGPRNIAHRGSSARAPENTLRAFALAVIEDGADGLELDLQSSCDGDVLVLHDSTLERTTNGTGQADAQSLASLRALDAGFHFRDHTGDYPFRGLGLRIPTLREVLQRFPDTWLSLELKQGDRRVQSNTVQLLREFRDFNNVALGSEDPKTAAGLRQLAPECDSFFSRRDAWRFYIRFRLHTWWRYLRPGRSLQIPVAHGGLRFDDPRLIRDAHQHGIAVRYWTVNEATEMNRLLDLGADGLITDYPARLRDVLQARVQRSSSIRSS